MSNPNPSPETRFGGPRGNKPGRIPGRVSPIARLRKAFDREAPIKGRDSGHGITYLDIMVESIRRQACKGDFKFVEMAFTLLDDDAIQSELDRLKGIVDGNEPSGDAERGQAVDGAGDEPQVEWRD
jgi:hypothetical protein